MLMPARALITSDCGEHAAHSRNDFERDAVSRSDTPKVVRNMGFPSDEIVRCTIFRVLRGSGKRGGQTLGENPSPRAGSHFKIKGGGQECPPYTSGCDSRLRSFCSSRSLSCTKSWVKMAGFFSSAMRLQRVSSRVFSSGDTVAANI